MTENVRERTAAADEVRAEGRTVAALAGLLADATRAAFCLALLDGRAWTANELARHAGVAASTATAHLNTLTEGGLLAEERQGRHRYVRLAGPEAAELVEHLAALAPRQHTPAPRTLSATTRRSAMARARTCYDHLAGLLGVTITEAMAERGLLDWERGPALTPAGVDWLGALGITLPPGSKRPAVRPCLDFTERRPHLAGTVGAAICRHAFEAGWIVRIGTTRAVSLTPEGRQALASRLDLRHHAILAP
ncbi:ArsR/SmtB family transcription factor [Saccharothrix sp. ST-888]|uniref:ArsR/SmtB family transcription factor n=1 Tax=Saccharothrix sp. ST-888 TaxID=1427391 RepID=UPI000A45CE2A|nr:helix-turn-helix domain-containing protein [Saccharothrix sp. ST-888]